MNTDLLSLPAATTTFSTAGGWSSQTFSEYLPLVLAGAGLIIGGIIVAAFLRWITAAAGAALRPKKETGITKAWNWHKRP